MKEGGTPLKASQAKFPRHIQNTKVYLKDFSEHLKSMLDDSNYKFSEEYEVYMTVSMHSVCVLWWGEQWFDFKLVVSIHK